MALQFKEWVLLEMLGNFDYKLPEDREQQLYDFYMLSQLLAQSGMGKKDDSWSSSPETQYADTKDKLRYAIQNAASTLFPVLKRNLLKAVMYSLCAEMRHVFSRNSPDSIFALINENLGEKYATMFKKYAKNFVLLQDETGKQLVRTNPRAQRMPKGEPENNLQRTSSYKAAMKEGKPEDWAKIQELLYSKAGWPSSYGGPAWAQIAQAWSKLFAAQDVPSQMIWIDHIYDLQHNTGSVFNKLETYAKEGGHQWLKDALDFKASAKHPIELADKVSPQMRRLALPALKAFTGKTLEDLHKGKAGGAFPGPFAHKSTDTANNYEIDAYGTPDPYDNKSKEEMVHDWHVKAYPEMIGSDIIKSARIWLSMDTWNLQPQEKLETFDKIRNTLGLTGEIGNAIVKEKKEIDGLNAAGKLGSVHEITMEEAKTLWANGISSVVQPNISPDSVDEIFKIMNTASTSLFAIKRFKSMTLYPLLAAKGAIVYFRVWGTMNGKLKPGEHQVSTGHVSNEIAEKIKNYWNLMDGGQDTSELLRAARIFNMAKQSDNSGDFEVANKVSNFLATIGKQLNKTAIIEKAAMERNIEEGWGNLNVPTPAGFGAYTKTEAKQIADSVPSWLQPPELSQFRISKINGLLMKNQVIEAIKEARLALYWGLKAAKNYASVVRAKLTLNRFIKASSEVKQIDNHGGFKIGDKVGYVSSVTGQVIKTGTVQSLESDGSLKVNFGGDGTIWIKPPLLKKLP
jgi:hypothetical protein